MSARLNRRGAILPLTILMLAIMGVAVAITHARLSSERRTTADAQAQVQAFAVAQSGLSRYLSTLNAGGVKPGWPFPLGAPTTVEVTYNDLPGGTATVSLTMVRDTTTAVDQLPAVYAVTSRGVNTTARRFGASAPAAERSVATYALWTPAPMEVAAAVTSLGGMDKSGGSGALSGVDACGVSPAVAGVAVTTGSGVAGVDENGDPVAATSYTGPTGPIDGNPDNTVVSLGTPGAAGTAVDEVDIDWAGISAWPGTTLPPDYLLPTWPTPAQMADWPVVRVNNNGGPEFVLPANGKGILIVTGDLRLNGNTASWDGLILAGGRIRSNGDNTASGAVIAGLNVKLGQTVLPSDMNGTKQYRYNSCNLKRALGQVGSIQRVRNGWVDTWPSY